LIWQRDSSQRLGRPLSALEWLAMAARAPKYATLARPFLMLISTRFNGRPPPPGTLYANHDCGLARAKPLIRILSDGGCVGAAAAGEGNAGPPYPATNMTVTQGRLNHVSDRLGGPCSRRRNHSQPQCPRERAMARIPKTGRLCRFTRLAKPIRISRPVPFHFDIPPVVPKASGKFRGIKH